MLLTELGLDILIYLSTNLYINTLSNFILHSKHTYNNRYAFLKNNVDYINLNHYLLFDYNTSYYHILFFNNTLPDINRRYNRNELYAITNILSYYVANNVFTKDVAELYLLTIYTRATHDNLGSLGSLNLGINPTFTITNILKRNYKNTRLKLCCKIFRLVFNYDWEYLNINLYDLFSIIDCVVYKRYNELYGILYHLKIHKSLMPLKTLFMLLHYKEDIDATDTQNNTDADILCFAIIYILYHYIEHIHHYIKESEFKKLIPAIIAKCGEIKDGLQDSKKLPNNLKIMFLKKINNVYDIFYTVSSYS
jgi:hypothetical protein